MSSTQITGIASTAAADVANDASEQTRGALRTLTEGRDAAGLLKPVEIVTDSAGSASGAVRIATKARKIYDSGVVAGGAQLTTGVLDVSGYFAVGAYLDNSSGTLEREIGYAIVDDDGTTELHSGVRLSVRSGNKGLLGLGQLISYSIYGGVGQLYCEPMPLANKIQLTVAAVASGSARLRVYVR